MAEQIISPGVFTRETDQSNVSQAVNAIGGAIVGPTVKGPALVPTRVSTFSEFQNLFGSYTNDSYIPFTVEEYLRSGQTITVTRLLYEDGYSLSNGALAIVAESGSAKYVTHVLHPTVAVLGSGSLVSTNYFEDTVLNNYQSGSFEIKVSGSFTTQNVNGVTPTFTNGASLSASINILANNYVGTLFGKTPNSTTYPVYTQYENRSAITLFNNPGNVSVSLQKIPTYEFSEDYKVATTPWITSQKVGSLAMNLFRLHTLSHGTNVNYEIKVAISNIKTSSEVADPAGYSTFTVTVRLVNQTNITNSPFTSNDTDSQPEIVESFSNVNLNPASSRYIERVIGNRYQTVNSENRLVDNREYPNISKYVRVEVDPAVSSGTISNTLIPFGFRALNCPIPNVSGSINLAPATYKQDMLLNSTYNAAVHYGFDFTLAPNMSYLAPIPTSGSSTGSNSDFYLGDISQPAAANFPAGNVYSGTLESALTSNQFTKIKSTTRKFIVPFQGGFDGTRPNLPKFSGANITSANTFGFDCSGTSTTGTVAYRKAFGLLGNTDQYDINMLITPGIIDSLHSAVSSEARALCAQTRLDTFYIMDSNALTDSIETVISQVTPIDNSYTATYWPWVRINNPSNNIPTWVPPSVVIPGALTFNDQTARPWYAPAGLNRGGLTTVTGTYQNLSQSDRDDLYQARINPIANFPVGGVVIWGQKTLQSNISALNRVNVRRLLITVKKFIASVSRFLVFEPNDQAIRDRFLGIVNPYLEQVRAERGLTAFQVRMDNTNNTSADIDAGILNGQLFLQPTRTAEFIVLDFTIQATGAAFPE